MVTVQTITSHPLQIMAVSQSDQPAPVVHCPAVPHSQMLQPKKLINNDSTSTGPTLQSSNQCELIALLPLDKHIRDYATSDH